VHALFPIVVAVGSGAHHAGLRREVEHVPQRVAIAVRAVQVPGAAAGVVWDRHEPGGCGEVAGAGERADDQR
jgi:hypothetical protein